jgi:hypothetical protein
MCSSLCVEILFYGEHMKKFVKFLKITLAVALIFGLVFGGTVTLAEPCADVWTYVIARKRKKYTTNSQISEIEIGSERGVNLEVQIVESPDERIRIEYPIMPYMAKIIKHDGKLEYKEMAFVDNVKLAESLYDYFNFPDSQFDDMDVVGDLITLYLPKNYDGSLKINTSGHIRTSYEYESTPACFETVTGDMPGKLKNLEIRANGVYTDDITAEKINITFLDSFVAGTIDSNDLQILSGCGSVLNLNLAGKEEDYSIESCWSRTAEVGSASYGNGPRKVRADSCHGEINITFVED